jgi:hypothetical protein
MADINFEGLTVKEKFMDVVSAFKLSYRTLTDKRLTNDQLAAFVGVKREHFQKMVNSDQGIDIAKVENLLSRYVLWHYATKLGIDADEALYPSKVWGTLLNEVHQLNEKSGSGEPDLQTLRKQISTALISLQEAIQTLPAPLGPEIGAAGDPAFRKAGKTKRTEKQ